MQRTAGPAQQDGIGARALQGQGMGADRVAGDAAQAAPHQRGDVAQVDLDLLAGLRRPRAAAGRKQPLGGGQQAVVPGEVDRLEVFGAEEDGLPDGDAIDQFDRRRRDRRGRAVVQHRVGPRRGPRANEGHVLLIGAQLLGGIVDHSGISPAAPPRRPASPAATIGRPAPPAEPETRSPRRSASAVRPPPSPCCGDTSRDRAQWAGRRSPADNLRRRGWSRGGWPGGWAVPRAAVESQLDHVAVARRAAGRAQRGEPVAAGLVGPRSAVPEWFEEASASVRRRRQPHARAAAHAQRSAVGVAAGGARKSRDRSGRLLSPRGSCTTPGVRCPRY